MLPRLLLQPEFSLRGLLFLRGQHTSRFCDGTRSCSNYRCVHLVFLRFVVFATIPAIGLVQVLLNGTVEIAGTLLNPPSTSSIFTSRYTSIFNSFSRWRIFALFYKLRDVSLLKSWICSPPKPLPYVELVPDITRMFFFLAQTSFCFRFGYSLILKTI